MFVLNRVDITSMEFKLFKNNEVNIKLGKYDDYDMMISIILGTANLEFEEEFIHFKKPFYKFH